MKTFMQIRCNFPDISYLSETQKNNFQILSKQLVVYRFYCMAFFHSQTQRPMLNANKMNIFSTKEKFTDYAKFLLITDF